MADFKYLVDLNLVQNELQNAVIQNLTADPSGLDGQVYYNTTSNVFKGYVNGAWETFLTSADTYISTITFNDGTGTTASTGGTASDPIFSVSLDYLGTNNFIDSATNLEGTGIATGDTIIYHDATDNNVKKGFVSDLPFDPTGTDNSTDVTLNLKVQDVLSLTTQEISAVDFNADAIAGYDNTAEKFTYLDAATVRSIINVADGANNYVHPNHTGQVTSTGDGATVVTVSAITAQTALTTGLLSTDELLVNDGGVLKRMDVSVIEAYMQANLSFGGTYDFDAGANQNVDQTVDAADLLDITASAGTTIAATPIETAVSKVGTTVTVAISLDFIDDDTLATATATNISSSESIKAYVDSAVSGALVYQGGYNASTDTPSLDDGTPIAGILTGHTYTVTVAGDFFTEAVQVGDMLIAEVDSPTVLADWTVVNKNIPDIVDASETAKGLVEEATDAEVAAGTAVGSTGARLYVNPAKLQTELGTPGADNASTRRFEVACAAATSTTVTHNFGFRGVQVEVYRTTTPWDTVGVTVERTDTNTVTVRFNSAPAAGAFNIVVIG